MKVFLTGASGLLGSHVARVAARRGHEVTGIVDTWPHGVPGAGRVLRLDLTCEADVQRVVLDYFPDAIVNCAALSSPAAVDRQPERARDLNVALPETLAKLAHHLGARLVHVSSEQVFDGRTSTPYRADDPVNPINEYARQKMQSEQAVGTFARETGVTVRLPLLGGNSLTGTRSLHERLFAEWAAGRRTRLYRDEHRQVCTAENAAEVIVELLERSTPRGIVHWAGAEVHDRVTLGRAIATHFGLPAASLIEEGTRADHPGGADTRQEWLALDCTPLVGLLKTRPETLGAMLDRLFVPQPCRAWYAALGVAPPTNAGAASPKET